MKMYVGKQIKLLVPEDLLGVVLFWKNHNECSEFLLKHNGLLNFLWKVCDKHNALTKQTVKVSVKERDYDSAYTIIAASALPLVELAIRRAPTTQTERSLISFIDEEDVPPLLMYTEHHMDKWLAILEDIRWSFSVSLNYVQNFNSIEEFDEKFERGFRLFGKYYTHIFR